MKHYFLAQIKVNDPGEYDKYLEQVDEIFSKHNGEYLSIDESPALLEGDWNYSKSVLIKFNSKQEFKDWYYSNDYQKILKHRLKAAKCDTILIKGLE